MKRFFNIVMTFFLVVLCLARSPQPALGLAGIDPARGSLAPAFHPSSNAITGTILDRDGNPLSNILVDAIPVNEGAVGNNVYTQANGAYRLAVSPGDYKVGTSSLSSDLYAATYYPNVYDLNAAQVITVGYGQTVTNIDLVLQPSATITGKLLGEDGNPVPGSSVHAMAYNGAPISRGAFTAADGTFQISGLPPVAYRVMATTSQPGYLNTYYDNVVSWYAATPLPLTAGQVFPDMNMTLYQDHPSTHLQVWVNENRIEGINWPMLETVTVTIDDPAIPGSPDYADNTQSYGNFSLNLYNSFKLKAGQTVTATTEGITRSMVITPLALSGVDRIQDTVFGSADPGSVVQVNAYFMENEQGQQIDESIVRHAQVDGNGKWSVDFSQTGPQPGEGTTWDITIGSQLLVSQADEKGNETAQFWYVRTPTIGVRPDTETIVGREWPAGADIQVQVDDPATPQEQDITASVVPDWVSSDPGHTLFTIDLTYYDIKVGDVVTVSDGETTRQHTVQYVAITDVDPDSETASGSATPERFVFAHACSQDRCVYAEAYAPDGSWSINFSDPEQTLGGTLDIGPGSWVDAAVMEENEDGDVTEAHFEVPVNEPPENVVILAPEAPVPVTQSVSIQAAFSDPDEDQAHTVVLEWGDGTSSQVTTTGLAVSAEHQYASAGVLFAQSHSDRLRRGIRAGHVPVSCGL